MPDIALIMGSKSDFEVVLPAIRILKDFQVNFEVKVFSAHRTPHELRDYLNHLKKTEVKVIIAAAGGAAHLPGVIASEVEIPVIGLPVKSEDLNGLDSILSMVQMPEGVPVATVGINRAKNAALLAIQILSLVSEKLKEKYENFRKKERGRILSAEVNINEV